MSSEATLRVSLLIRKDNLNFQSNPTTFQADVSKGVAPTPGRITASIHGTNVDLSKLATPGLCWIQNLDTVNFVEYGITDPATNKFFPLGELLPGECFPLRLSRNIREDYYNTGTGTTGNVNNFTFKADTAPCEVNVLVFEK